MRERKEGRMEGRKEGWMDGWMQDGWMQDGWMQDGWIKDWSKNFAHYFIIILSCFMYYYSLVINYFSKKRDRGRNWREGPLFKYGISSKRHAFKPAIYNKNKCYFLFSV